MTAGHDKGKSMGSDEENGDQGKSPVSVNIDITPELIEQLDRSLTRFLGPVAEGWSWLGKRARIYLIVNVARAVKRAEEISRVEGLNISPPPLKFLIPWAEKCSLEEDDNLQEMWARLLSGAAHDYNAQHPIFVEILSQLGPREVKLLNHIWEHFNKHNFDKFETMLGLYDQGPYWGKVRLANRDHFMISSGTTFDDASKTKDYSSESLRDENMYMLSVLERQNLIKIRTTRQVREGTGHFLVEAILTSLGYDFVEACREKTAAANDPKGKP